MKGTENGSVVLQCPKITEGPDTARSLCPARAAPRLEGQLQAELDVARTARPEHCIGRVRRGGGSAERPEP